LINEIAYTQPEAGKDRIKKFTQSVIAFTLLLYVLFAPHSIAVTQASFLLGLLAWGVEIIATRDFKQKRTPIDLAIFGFFACCVVSSFFSYELLTSVKGLKSPAFFLAFYFISNNIKTLRFAKFLGYALILSCMINVVYSAGQIAIGRGLRIDSIQSGSPFDKEELEVGDVVLEADDQKVKTLDDLSRIADQQRGRMQILFQRNEVIGEASISRKAIRKSGETGAQRFGITASPGRNFRVTGFYSHYETYAEVLQLIAAFVVGLLIAFPKKNSVTALLLGLAALFITATLIMTSTRAALAGIALAVVVMAFASYRRRVVALAILAILLFAPFAYYAIKHSRGAQIFNPQEDSAQYRLEVWREALWLIKDHPLTGIGKGSEGGAFLREKYALYNGGRLPPGHFHSTPIQIATWWGLPALAFYAALMAIFFREMWKLCQSLRDRQDWHSWGIVLGGMGALTAFNVSSLAHFNFGDGEVVMMLWLFTGLVFAVRRLIKDDVSSEPAGRKFAPSVLEDLHKNQLPALEAIAESNVRAAAVTQNSKSQ
jgi:hypothetical protein